MRYIWQHIDSIVSSYNGSIPLTYFLKNYFKLHPRLGSRDRKILGEMAYCWYRSSRGFHLSIPFEEKVKSCLTICGAHSKHILPFLPQESSEKYPFLINQLFDQPYTLSSGIKKSEWLESMLAQPRLFIRIRKKKAKILAILREHSIEHEQLNVICLSLPNGAAIDKILPPDYYVVQDASSQETGNFFEPRNGETWYDCCAGAGGKSLLLKDINPSVSLTVSDKRVTIIRNLNSRFDLYHLKRPVAHILDVADKKQVDHALKGQMFDNIICDVPCSGSGTWSRTPEQLYYFDNAALATLPALQKTIAVNASVHLKPGGKLFYITCSVFEIENENVVKNIAAETNLSIQSQTLINGIKKHADSMFITVLTKQ